MAYLECLDCFLFIFWGVSNLTIRMLKLKGVCSWEGSDWFFSVERNPGRWTTSFDPVRGGEFRLKGQDLKTITRHLPSSSFRPSAFGKGRFCLSCLIQKDPKHGPLMTPSQSQTLRSQPLLKEFPDHEDMDVYGCLKLRRRAFGSIRVASE